MGLAPGRNGCWRIGAAVSRLMWRNNLCPYSDGHARRRETSERGRDSSSVSQHLLTRCRVDAADDGRPIGCSSVLVVGSKGLAVSYLGISYLGCNSAEGPLRCMTLLLKNDFLHALLLEKLLKQNSFPVELPRSKYPVQVTEVTRALSVFIAVLAVP